MHRFTFLSGPAAHRLAHAAPVAAGLALAAAVIPAGLASAAPAALPAGCTQSGATVTCSYGYTGAEQTFTVPDGVTMVQATAIGAAGAASFFTPSGAGRGAQVTGELTGLTSGQTLYVEVGGTPTTTGCYPGDGCVGGFNGGGSNGHYGGAGGGASDVRPASSAASGSLSSRLLVAGGGGGGGAMQFCGDGPEAAGGAGGDAGQPGAGGGICPSSTATSTGGGAGTSTGGGAGGVATYNSQTSTGHPGSLGTGGASAAGTAGGGGGGLYGGGGGAENFFDINLHGNVSAASGGGGGSSLVPQGGSHALTSSPASATISYTVPATPTTTTLASSANPSKVGTQVTYTATISPAPGGGTVAFTDNGTTITGCSGVSVSGATASCPTSPGSTGAHNVVATFTGTGTYAGSTAATVTQVVTRTRCATLAGCNLSGLNFTNAQLAGANLSGANFNKANLTGANLNGATVTNTNFNKVTWSNTTCPDGTNSNNDGGTCAGHL